METHKVTPALDQHANYNHPVISVLKPDRRTAHCMMTKSNAMGAGKCRDWNSLRTKPRLCDYCSPGSQWGKNPFHMMHSLFAAKHAPGLVATKATVHRPSPKTTESLLQHLGRSGENAHKINSQCHLEEFCIIDRNELSFSFYFEDSYLNSYVLIIVNIIIILTAHTDIICTTAREL